MSIINITFNVSINGEKECKTAPCKGNRGLIHAPAWIWILSLSSECSEQVRYRVEHKKRKFISEYVIFISKYVIFYLLYKHQWNTKSACFQRHDLLCNHNDGDHFTCEDNMLSSCVKIRSFRGKAHLIFHWYYLFAFVESSLRQLRKSSSESKTNFSISYFQRLGCLNHDLQMKSL